MKNEHLVIIALAGYLFLKDNFENIDFSKIIPGLPNPDDIIKGGQEIINQSYRDFSSGLLNAPLAIPANVGQYQSQYISSGINFLSGGSQILLPTSDNFVAFNKEATLGQKDFAQELFYNYVMQEPDKYSMSGGFSTEGGYFLGYNV